MKLQILNRKLHYWLAIVVAAPAILVFGTGLLLQLKKQLPWVQPPEQRGVATIPTIPLERILEICAGLPDVEVRTWDDINRIDLRPGRGLMKVLTKTSWEVQIDAQTGTVLQVAYRRSDLIESLHDGSWFHDWVKLGLVLPAGVILVVLWLTGLYLFWLPIVVRRRRRTVSSPGISKTHQAEEIKRPHKPLIDQKT
jgi:uncharacterized iron-regulated membrane protein